MIARLKSFLRPELSPYEVALVTHHFADRCAFCETRVRRADATIDRLVVGKRHHVLACRPCGETATRGWRARVRAKSRKTRVAHARTRRILDWVKRSAV